MRIISFEASQPVDLSHTVASAVWHLLAEPMTRDQIVDVIHSAFPEVAPEQIAGDITTLIGDLGAKGVLITLPEEAS